MWYLHILYRTFKALYKCCIIIIIIPSSAKVSPPTPDVVYNLSDLPNYTRFYHLVQSTKHNVVFDINAGLALRTLKHHQRLQSTRGQHQTHLPVQEINLTHTYYIN